MPAIKRAASLYFRSYTIIFFGIIFTVSFLISTGCFSCPQLNPPMKIKNKKNGNKKTSKGDFIAESYGFIIFSFLLSAKGSIDFYAIDIQFQNQVVSLWSGRCKHFLNLLENIC